MKRRLMMCLATMLALLVAPLAALAQQADEKVVLDARLEGYAQAVTLESGSTALTWVLFIFLAVVALGGMFKNAKRTHLD